MEIDKYYIHFLLSYNTMDKICDIVKIVKQETTDVFHKRLTKISVLQTENPPIQKLIERFLFMKKKSYKLSDLSPAGWDYRLELIWCTVGLVGIAFISFISFAASYYNAYENLFIYRDPSSLAESQIMNGAMMPPFSHLIRFSTAGFILLFAAMIILAFNHYLYHQQGSKSLYLMRRLPDRWELFRRCTGIPILVSVIGLAVMGVMTGLYYFYYIVHTPAQCLP